jgi:hypothetical protein
LESETGEQVELLQGLVIKVSSVSNLDFFFFETIAAFYFFFLCILFFYFFYSYVHTMFGSFLPPSLHLLPLSPLLPSLPGRNYFALVSDFVEERV